MNARLAQTAAADAWILRLYVAGQTTRSLRAVENIKRICQENLDNRYTLEVVDLQANPLDE